MRLCQLLAACFMILMLPSCSGETADTRRKKNTPQSSASYGFRGQIFGDRGRIKIPIEPNRAVNVGMNFTIEFWLKMPPGSNANGSVNTSATDGSGWVGGHIVIDRDIDDSQGSNSHGDFGIALADGRPAFGVAKGTNGKTIYASSAADLRDGTWHHIAVTRNASSGQMKIFVDGIEHASGIGPTGDISYQDNRATTRPNSDPYLVIGCEKHDYDSTVLGYEGLLTGLRFSHHVRYTGNFTVAPAKPAADSHTVALYLFESWDGENFYDELNLSPGIVKTGSTPFAPYPSLDAPWAE